MIDRGKKLLPIITTLSYLLVGIGVVSLAVLFLDFKGYCPDIGIGGETPVPCSFGQFYFDIDHLPLMAIEALFMLVIVLLYLVRLGLFLAGMAHSEHPEKRK